MTRPGEAARDRTLEREARFGGFACAVIVLIFLVTSARWILLYRDRYLLDVDEAGYLGMAFSYYDALMHGGWLSWISAVFAPGANSPVLPAATSLGFAAFRPSVYLSLFIPALFGAVALFSTYVLAKRISGSYLLAIIATAALASCPVFVVYSRSFHFSEPATAVLSAALVAANISNRFSRWLPAMSFGILVGLLPLTRTMTLAFIPGLLLGHLLWIVSDRTALRRRILIFTVSVVVAMITAATWLWPSAQIVFGYLLDFGYGNQATNFGPKSSPFSVDSWLFTASYLAQIIYFPHFILIFISTVAAVATLLIRGALQRERGASWRSVVGSPLVPLACTVLVGFTALTSTSNKGSAFMLPLLPPTFVLCAMALRGLAAFQAGKVAAAFAVLGIALIAFIPLADLRLPTANLRLVSIPLLGTFPFSSGRATFEGYYAALMGISAPAADPIGTDRDGWREAFRKVQDVLEGSKPPVGMVSNHFLINGNTLPLQAQMVGLPRPNTVQLFNPQPDASLAAYQAWLSGVHSGICALVFITGKQGEFMPPISSELFHQAAISQGYSREENFSVPGGENVEIWRRRCSG